MSQNSHGLPLDGFTPGSQFASSPYTRPSPASSQRFRDLPSSVATPSSEIFVQGVNTPRNPQPTNKPPQVNGYSRDGDTTSEESVNIQRRNVLHVTPTKVVDQVGEKVAEAFLKFLESYRNPNIDPQDPQSAYYISQIHSLKHFQVSTVYVDFSHLQTVEDGVLADAITDKFSRFLPFLQTALHKAIDKYEPSLRRSRERGMGVDALNGLESDETTNATSSTDNDESGKIYQLGFYNLPVVNRIRDLRSDRIGTLMSISGTVTRTSEVRPELYRATFTCDVCHSIITNVEQAYKFTEPRQCSSAACDNKFAWSLNVAKSQFIDWQKVRIQENANEIPTGSMPRTLDVILRGEIVDRAKAGDKCVFVGTEIVIPDVAQLGLPGVKPTALRNNSGSGRTSEGLNQGITGLKVLGVRDLTYKLAFLGNMVQPSDSSEKTPGDVRFDDELGSDEQKVYLESLTDAEIMELKGMVYDPRIYANLVDSIAPTVFGHKTIKKGILLQLMGGVHKTTVEGISLRGDINVCIVGDPSTSKSQFLKYVTNMLPRAIYTSGKASSAAGLTAAVVRDEETGEYTIEAGALMLADNGICAIDEFDKMNISDQVAIHEAMEQQTISIAKAGIQATLNARTSILAAANPINGRYNKKASLRANINMSAPIMSRFDLFFVVLDDPKEQVDTELATHIVNLHMQRDEAINPPYDSTQLQRYIKYARTFKPTMSKKARKRLVEKYKELREDDAQGLGRNSYRITVRQLESMIRLCEAIAKANCENKVSVEMVDEAYELLRQSIVHVDHDDVVVDGDENNSDFGGDNNNDDYDNGAVLAGGSTQMSTQGDTTDTLRNDFTSLRLASEQIASEAQSSQSASVPQVKQKVKINYEQYVTMVRILMKGIDIAESGRALDQDGNDEISRTGEDGQSYSTPNHASSEGITKDELVEWYLAQREAHIETVEQLAAEQALARKVVDKMVQDKLVMVMRGEGLTSNDGLYGQQSSRKSELVSQILVRHPNNSIVY